MRRLLRLLRNAHSLEEARLSVVATADGSMVHLDLALEL